MIISMNTVVIVTYGTDLLDQGGNMSLATFLISIIVLVLTGMVAWFCGYYAGKDAMRQEKDRTIEALCMKVKSLNDALEVMKHRRW